MIESVLQRRWFTIWQRHFQVWQKLKIPSLLANFGEPLLVLVALGYGLGHFIGYVDNMTYIAFLASGIVCTSALEAATFECLYAAYTRMAVQQTWAGMLATPLNVADIILGEMAWAATKSFLSASALLLVAVLLGIVSSWQVIWVLPLMLLLGLCFAAMALVFTTLAQNYDFFMYYIILLITPMTLLSGVFFPLEKLPQIIQWIVHGLPLVHAVKLTRPLMIGQPLEQVFLHLGVIIVYMLSATYLAINLLKQRLYH